MKCDELTDYTSPTYGSPYYDIDEVDAAIAELKANLAEQVAKTHKLERALYKAFANWALAESYSVLNDVPTANRWAKLFGKLKTKAEAYK